MAKKIFRQKRLKQLAAKFANLIISPDCIHIKLTFKGLFAILQKAFFWNCKVIMQTFDGHHDDLGKCRA